MATERSYKLFTILALLFFFGSFQAFTQDNIEEIAQAINEGDAEILSGHFSKSVDIGLPEKDQEYRSSQGKIVMEEFFELHPPDSFVVHQEGSTDPMSTFLIGEYTSADTQFQVLVILKKEGGLYLIHKLKFEAEEQ